MNKLKARNGRVYCDMCNQSFLDEAACKPFLKDGETVVDCIKRNQNDVSMMLRLLAKEKARVAELEAENEKYSLGMQENCALRSRVAKLEALLKDAENSLDPHYDMALVIEIREALAGKEKA